MTKKELIRYTSLDTGLSQEDVEAMLDSITTVIGNALIIGEDVKITEFGTFKIKEVSARRNTDISTGETRITKISHVIKFVPCIELKNAVK